MNEEQEKLDEAYRRGRFEGQVMTHLTEIKTAVQDLKTTQNGHSLQLETKAERAELKLLDEEIREKVDNTDFQELVKSVESIKRFMWFVLGALTIIQVIIKFI